jgi:hypothetical protein
MVAVSSRLALLSILLLGLACAEETAEWNDPYGTSEFWFGGDNLYSVVPLSCDDCRHVEIRRFEGDVLGVFVADFDSDPLAEVGERALGELTPEGIAAIEQLGTELVQALEAEQVELEQAECFLSASSTVQLSWPEQVTLFYGVDCIPPELLALDEFYQQLIADLAECQTNAWVVPWDQCTPVDLLESN